MNLADRIYEAAVLPEFWPTVLKDMAEAATGGHGIIFSMRDADVQFIASSEKYRQDAIEFFSRYAENERTGRLLAEQRTGFITDYEVFGFEHRERLEVFRDFLIPRGYGDGAATVIPLAAGDKVIVHIEGRYSRTPFSRTVVDWLDSLRPHLARSALVSARLAFERARTAVETLAALGLPACAVRASGAVIIGNGEFEVETAFWTTRGGNRIALHDRRADTQLYHSLGIAAASEGVRSLPVVGRDGTPPMVLHIVPVRRAAHDLFAQAMAILVLARTSDTPTQATPLLQALFDLTPTEADLAARIAAGQTVEEVAQASAKSSHTVRQQLKSVLAKTGCRRQLDLARMLGQLLPIR